jgi:glutamate-1-semialdehyde 2,1-aminomutase
MKLDPDIVTLGKIVGGGMAIGVLCGKKEIMQYADTTGKKKSERSYVGGGTFSANPASMVSGFSTLMELKNSKIYSKINELGEYTRKELGKVFDSRVIITGKGSLFMTHFVRNGVTEVANSVDAARCDTETLKKYHFKMIAQDGIFFLPGKLGAISNAHSKNDIKKMVVASENFVSQDK